MGALTSTATSRSPGVRNGTEHHGDGDGGADGVEQAAGGELYFLLAQNVRGQGGVRQGQAFDGHVGNYLFQFADEAIALHQAVAAQGEIGQLEHLALVPTAQPFFAFGHPSGGIHGTHHGSHGAAGDGGDFVAMPRAPPIESTRDIFCFSINLQ